MLSQKSKFRYKVLLLLSVVLFILLYFSLSLITTDHIVLDVQHYKQPYFKESSAVPRISSARVETLPGNPNIGNTYPDIRQDPLPDTIYREDIVKKKAPYYGSIHSNANYPSVRIQKPYDSQDPGVSSSMTHEKLKVPYKLIHLDLKGAPPKLPYLKHLLNEFKAAGCNGLLIEYEDMFPFEGILANISHKNAYTKDGIKDFLHAATEMDFEIIPLVQTFGHLEFMLKIDGFQKYREVLEFPQEICPSMDKAVNLVTEMIDQVLSFHRSVVDEKWLNYAHIGCDEVYHLGECSRCRNHDSKDLFISHVTKIAKYVRDKYKAIPIIWDDMLRKFYTDELQKSHLGSLVEVMVWDYTEDVDHLISPYLWPMYSETFPNIWVASAFKGAFGESLYQVHIERHALNQMSWLKTLSREMPRIKNFRGFAITGWSRYDHFSVLCELLPVSIPSALLTLLVLKDQDMKEASKELTRQIKCQFESNHISLVRLDECEWQGRDLFVQISSLKFYQDSTDTLAKTWGSNKGWLTPYNVKYNETSTWRLEEPRTQAEGYLESLRTVETGVQEAMEKYFDQFVIDEWIELRITPIKDQLQTIIKNIRDLNKRITWDRRPLKLRLKNRNPGT